MAAPARLDFSRPHGLRNAREYRIAMREVDALLDADAGAKDRERLEFLSLLVQDYEDRSDPITNHAASPREVVAFMLEQRGMARRALRRYGDGTAPSPADVVPHESARHRPAPAARRLVC